MKENKFLKYKTDAEKTFFITQHPKLTSGFIDYVNLCTWTYPDSIYMKVKFMKFAEDSHDLHFRDAELGAMGDTYSTALDCLYQQVMNLYGDYDYDETTEHRTRIETYKTMKERLDQLIQKTEKDLQDYLDF